MKFYTFGNRENPHVMLIHGGGNAWWSYLRQARLLSEKYHVILPNLDGHGESGIPYVSTEDSADKLMSYIEESCGGHLHALCGVSLGGQIVAELLSRKADLTKKAIIDGSVCYPQPGLARFCIASVSLFGGFLFSESACRRQVAWMPRLLPEKMQFTEEIKEYYVKDMPRTKRETLYTIYRTYMMRYVLKESLRETTAEVMYWYGSKEMRCVKKSAEIFKSFVPSCKIYEAKGYNHGYLSMYLPEEWMEKAEI